MIAITQGEIQKRVQWLAAQINLDYKGQQELVVICILKGGYAFTSDLVKYIEIPCILDFISVKSYSGLESTGIVTIKQDLSVDVKDKHVLIVDDILDSGLTLSEVCLHISALNPLSIKIAVLLDKKRKRNINIKPEYCGFVINDRFVYGYGLDLDQKYRNWPDIHILD